MGYWLQEHWWDYGNIVIGLCHVELDNIETFSDLIIEAIVACEVISTTCQKILSKYILTYILAREMPARLFDDIFVGVGPLLIINSSVNCTNAAIISHLWSTP